MFSKQGAPKNLNYHLRSNKNYSHKGKQIQISCSSPNLEENKYKSSKNTSKNISYYHKINNKSEQKKSSPVKIKNRKNSFIFFSLLDPKFRNLRR